MKISAVSNTQFNNMTFESKKRKEVQAPVHSSNPVKAIPVALLIAMSPVNTTAIKANENNPQEIYMNSDFQTLKSFECNKKDPDAQSCSMKIVAANKNNDDIYLNIEKNISIPYIYANGDLGRRDTDVNIYIKPEILKTEIRETMGYTNENKTTKYYVTGSGYKITEKRQYHNDTQDDQTNNEPLLEFFDSRQYEINEETYNELKELLKDNVSYKNTKSIGIVSRQFRIR